MKADHCQPEEEETCIITAPSRERERGDPGGRGEEPPHQVLFESKRQVLTSCGPQSTPTQTKKIKFLEKEIRERLYSTCASPVVPHPSTGHAHGCLASEIGRDPAFPTRFDRTVSSPEVSLLTPSRHTIGRWKGTGCKNRIEREKREFSKELRGNRERE